MLVADGTLGFTIGGAARNAGKETSFYFKIKVILLLISMS